MVQPFSTRKRAKYDWHIYITLSSIAREDLSLREMITQLNQILNISDADWVIRYTLFEDKKGVEELVNVPKSRPRANHIAVQYHHVR